MPPRKSNPPASDAEVPSPEGTVSATATTPAVVEEADNASPPSPIPEKIYKEPKPPKPRDDDTLSVEDLNLFHELAAVRRLAPDVAAGRLLRSATIEGAVALGFGTELGSLERGKRAELLAVRVPAGVTDVEEYLVGGVEPADLRWLERPAESER